MLIRRMSTALLLSATALLVTAAPALAHTSLKSSNPAKGAALAAPPRQLELTFSEPVQVEPGAVTVGGPDGTQWTVGQVTVSGPVVTAPVTPTGPAGEYVINYRVISADGDPVHGKVPFTLTAAVPAPTTTTQTTTSSPAPTSTSQQQPAPAPQTPTPTAQQTEDSGGIPIWIWIAGAVLVIGAGIFVGLRARKSGKDVSE